MPTDQKANLWNDDSLNSGSQRFVFGKSHLLIPYPVLTWAD
ncbi:MAG: hypothetical protein WCJ88_01745 [Actinomycetes bacterium]